MCTMKLSIFFSLYSKSNITLLKYIINMTFKSVKSRW